MAAPPLLLTFCLRVGHPTFSTLTISFLFFTSVSSADFVSFWIFPTFCFCPLAAETYFTRNDIYRLTKQTNTKSKESIKQKFKQKKFSLVQALKLEDFTQQQLFNDQSFSPCGFKPSPSTTRLLPQCPQFAENFQVWNPGRGGWNCSSRDINKRVHHFCSRRSDFTTRGLLIIAHNQLIPVQIT